MKKSKLIQFLKILKREELKKFSEFLNSPFFNNDQLVVDLWNYLKPFYPAFDDEIALDKNMVYSALFPKAPFDGKQLSYLMNYLLKHGESFLQIQLFLGDESVKGYFLLRQYYNRDHNKHFQTAFNKSEKKILTDSKETLESHYYHHLFAQLQDDFLISKTLRRGNNPFLVKAHDHLDQYYFTNKIMYCCEMLNRRQIYSTDYNFQVNLLDEVENYLIQNQETLNPLLKIYFQIFLFLKEPENEEHFIKFREVLYLNQEKINDKELEAIYLHSINYSLRKIRNGKDEYIEIALETYQKGIENRILFEGNILPYKTFLNTYRQAVKLERYDWTEKFVHTYYKYLPSQTQKDAFHYSLADLYFQKAEYHKVLENVHQVQLGDMQYSLGARIIFIKTYYELDEIDPLLSLLASFTIFLKRNKNISEDWKRACLNFCSMVNKLVKLKPKKIESLRSEINSINPVVEKKWLSEKLKEQEVILA